MTEAEWLLSRDLDSMWLEIKDCQTDNCRKARHFACGCCRQIWSLIRDARSRRLVRVAERHADRISTDEELTIARRRAERVPNPPNIGSQSATDYHASHAALAVGQIDKRFFALNVAKSCDLAASSSSADLLCVDSPKGQCDLLRDVFGNPFRPVAFDPRWRTIDVTDLARAIYEDRAFDRMPVLADALMDAGCEDEQVIGHCRGPGPHVRGCWVVDLILGKE